MLQEYPLTSQGIRDHVLGIFRHFLLRLSPLFFPPLHIIPMATHRGTKHASRSLSVYVDTYHALCSNTLEVSTKRLEPNTGRFSAHSQPSAISPLTSSTCPEKPLPLRITGFCRQFIIIVVALLLTRVAMQVMTATSITNPNASWLNTRGMWLGYLTSVAILHFILMSVPFISTPMAWTLTHVVHNVVSGVAVCRLLRWVVGINSKKQLHNIIVLHNVCIPTHTPAHTPSPHPLTPTPPTHSYRVCISCSIT